MIFRKIFCYFLNRKIPKHLLMGPPTLSLMGSYFYLARVLRRFILIHGFWLGLFILLEHAQLFGPSIQNVFALLALLAEPGTLSIDEHLLKFTDALVLLPKLLCLLLDLVCLLLNLPCLLIHGLLQRCELFLHCIQDDLWNLNLAHAAHRLSCLYNST